MERQRVYDGYIPDHGLTMWKPKFLGNLDVEVGGETNVVQKIGRLWARQKGRNGIPLAARNDVPPGMKQAESWGFGEDEWSVVFPAKRDWANSAQENGIQFRYDAPEEWISEKPSYPDECSFSDLTLLILQ